MLKRIREWLVENKEELKHDLVIVTIMLLSVLFLITLLINIVLTTMCNDLVERIQIQEQTIEEMDIEIARQGITINAYMEREELCKSGVDIGDEEFSIICIQK